jgi:uncharacterized protein YjiS (DUF1127 family)
MVQCSMIALLKEGSMASYHFNYATVGPVAAEQPMGLKAWLGALIERRRERARIARELLSCNNRDLFDLGISSGDIPAVIDGSYRRC